MDDRLQEMLDHYEITKTLKAYCHGCDRCDEPRMRGVYLDDSWDEHGLIEATGPDFARFMTAKMLSQTSSVFHLLGQSQIKVDGDEAGAETYFIAVSRDRDDDDGAMLRQLGGRFVDRLQRVEGRWRIKRRTVVRDWSICHPAVHEWETTLAMTPGRRSDEDPSFAVLGLVHGGAATRPSGEAA